MPYRLATLMLLALLVIPNTGIAADVFKVNTSIKPPFSTQNEAGFFDVLIKELARRAGIETALVRLPPERALVSANEGISDMELPRIAGMEKKYHNLVMVEEKLIDYNFVAFTRNEQSIESWEDLANHRVGYIIGWKIFENNVPASAKCTKLAKPQQLLQMLANRRIDVALYEAYAGWSIVRSHDLAPVVESKPPLAVKPMYMYVHQSNAYLAKTLAKHLREMKKDGTYQKIVSQTLEAN